MALPVRPYSLVKMSDSKQVITTVPCATKGSAGCPKAALAHRHMSHICNSKIFYILKSKKKKVRLILIIYLAQ